MPVPPQPPQASSDIAEAEAAAAKRVAPTILLLMGVSGSGKSTVALELQRVLGWPFQEGDDLHPPANVEKMRSGQPLDDAQGVQPAAGLGLLSRYDDLGDQAGERPGSPVPPELQPHEHRRQRHQVR